MADGQGPLVPVPCRYHGFLLQHPPAGHPVPPWPEGGDGGTHHLVSQEQHGLEAELAGAEVEEVLEAGPQQLHDHHVVVPLGPAPLDGWDPHCGEAGQSGAVTPQPTSPWAPPRVSAQGTGAELPPPRPPPLWPSPPPCIIL